MQPPQETPKRRQCVDTGFGMGTNKQGRQADAAWVTRAFDEAWKDADATLTIEGL